MWKWLSTNGGATSRPCASTTTRASAAIAGSIADDAAVARGDVDSAAAVGQRRAADDEVESHQAP